MCDTDQQCQSPLAVTPVPPLLCKKPLILVISNPSSPLSFSLHAATRHSGSLCPMTLRACVCVSLHSHWCVQGRVKPGLCYMITGPSLFSSHTSPFLLFFLSTLQVRQRCFPSSHPFSYHTGLNANCNFRKIVLEAEVLGKTSTSIIFYV